MMVTTCRIRPLILSSLSEGEKRVLSVVVAVRKRLYRSEVFKGDLVATVKSALQRLVADGEVHERDGMYWLAGGRITRAAI